MIEEICEFTCTVLTSVGQFILGKFGMKKRRFMWVYFLFNFIIGYIHIVVTINSPRKIIILMYL